MKIAFQTAANLEDEEDREYKLNSPDYTINPLLQGLFRRGIREVFHYGTASLKQENGEVRARGHLVGLKKIRKNGKIGFSFRPYEDALNDYKLIFIRGDDVNERTLEQIILPDQLPDTILINSGAATLATKDKFLIPERFAACPELIPQTHCVHQEEDLLAAWNSLPGEYVILKGRYGSAGREVERFPRDSEGLNAAQRYFRKVGPVVAQEYLNDISKGDVRVHVFNGTVIGSLLRTPKETWLTNIMCGGRMQPLQLSREMEEKAKLYARFFSEVRFQGLDIALASGKFIETNAFPASLGDLNTLYGGGHEDIILDSLLK